MQKPHWTAPAARNASCSGMEPFARIASASTVRTSWPSACTAGTRHEQTSSPSSQTEHEPHSPSSHAFFVPVSPRSSRSSVSRLSRGRDVDRVARAVDRRVDQHRPSSASARARRASTSTTWRRYAAEPRRSSIGCASAAASRPNSASVAGSLQSRPCAYSSAPARTQHRRPHRAEREADAVPLLVGLEADARDRDHHRVAAPDLRERPGPDDGPPLDADDQLVGREARALRPDEELAERDPARPGASRCGHDVGAVAASTGMLSPAGDAVARFPPIVARLRICARCHRARGVRRAAGTRSALPRSGRTSSRRRGRPRRRPAATSRSSSTRERSRSAVGRTRPAFTSTIRSVPPATGGRLGMREPQLERLVQRAGGEDVRHTRHRRERLDHRRDVVAERVQHGAGAARVDVLLHLRPALVRRCPTR